MNLVQQYLSCYLALSDPQCSKQANRRLIEIEASPEAWSIASDLIQDSESERRIHGCQLLSKKLNNPLPTEISPNTIANFVYSQTYKSKLHWLCIAKAVLHMNPTTPLQLQILTSDQQRLALLRQMPSAIIQTHTKTLIDMPNLLNQYLEANKQMLLTVFDTHSDLVIDVLQNFIHEGTRLKNEALLMKLLRFGIQDVSGLLQTIFRHENYPALLEQILACLGAVEDNEETFNVQISFYRNHYKYLSNEQFSHMIGYVVNTLEKKEQSDFAESYYFWYDILMDHQVEHLSHEKTAIFEQAITILWRLICNKCLLNQLPDHKNIPKSSLSLSVDDDNQTEANLRPPLECNQHAQKFRQFAGDFLNLCIITFGESSSFVEEVNSSLESFAKNSLLELELAIYILSTISEIAPQATKSSKNAVTAILKRQFELNQYLCGRVIELISKLANLFTQSRDILSPCLSFLAKCLQFDGLAPLASESCCQLLQDTKVEESFLLSEDLQQFLGHLYDLFFSHSLTERTRYNIAKAMAIFIHKFKNKPDDYLEYLLMFSQRIESMSAENRAIFLESAIAAQFWVNVQNEQKYRSSFEEFLKLQANFLLENILAAQNKPQFTKAINLLNLAIKTNAISNIDTWIYLINEIMTKFISPETPLAIAMAPLINLTKAAIHLNDDEIISKLYELLTYWANSAIALLGDLSKPKIEFNISNNVVQLHLLLLQIYQKRPELIQTFNYSPNSLLIYICSCFDNSDIWEYDLYKNSLAYLTLAIKLGSPVEHILTVLFRNYKKFADTLWSAVEPLIFAAYKSSGDKPILKTLEDIKSALDSSNPLTDVLVNSLEKGEGKSIKNVLLCLS